MKLPNNQLSELKGTGDYDLMNMEMQNKMDIFKINRTNILTEILSFLFILNERSIFLHFHHVFKFYYKLIDCFFCPVQQVMVGGQSYFYTAKDYGPCP